MPYIPDVIVRGKNAMVLHVSVFLLLLALASLVAFFMPIDVRAFDIYFFVPPIFALYLGAFYLLQVRRRNSKRKEP